MRDVLDAYTKTAAWAEFEEDRTGAIEPGKLADLVVLSKDIVPDPPSTPDAVKIDVTVFDGKVVSPRNR